MRVVICADSLLGELSGIGYYTLNLIRAQLECAEIEELGCLVHGRLLEPEPLIASHDAPGLPLRARDKSAFLHKSQLWSAARTHASHNRVVVALYEKIMPILQAAALRKYRAGGLLHSPNYIMPPFPGPRVVSILDLSTVLFPQFHPEERVRVVNRHINHAIAEADQIITISNTVKEEIQQHYDIESERLSVTYLGASPLFRRTDPTQFISAAHEFDLYFKQYFIFVSTIEPRKNLSRLLDAYILYRERAGDSALPLIVAGGRGWKNKSLTSRLQHLHEAGTVRYLGYVSAGWLPVLLAGARALLFPSIYEGFGLPVLEAMQSGTAVLTSADSAMAEVGADAVIKIDPLDVEELADKIQRLAEDSGLVARIETLGLERAKLFSWEKCAKDTLDVYHKALDT